MLIPTQRKILPSFSNSVQLQILVSVSGKPESLDAEVVFSGCHLVQNIQTNSKPLTSISTFIFYPNTFTMYEDVNLLKSKTQSFKQLYSKTKKILPKKTLKVSNRHFKNFSQPCVTH